MTALLQEHGKRRSIPVVPVDVVTSTFRDWGRDNGFARKGTTLYRHQPETLAVVNLQGSQWGGRHYVNVALWLKAVEEPSHPREHECHIRARLTKLVADPDDLERLLTAESGLDDELRGQHFRSLLDEVLSPLLAQTGTLSDLKANRPGFLDRFLLGRDALPLLNAE